MTTSIIGITVAYTVLAVLVLNLNFYSRLPIWIKAGAILLTTALYFVTYLSLQGFTGWPTQNHLPDEFVVLSAHTEEPDKTTGTKGSIYLWILAREGNSTLNQPRAYRLPYSRELHTEIDQAVRQLNFGVTQLGKMESIPLRGQGTPQASLLEEYTKRIKIQDLPSPELPDK